ncbi:hypothetical protein [Inhella proteolytica]|uniref:Uncharacterized protein n=1 Tax=Inhella proteolytica TaxID=2795029 RepID=A0A931JAA9_9BURK|nr:hypothetical protein [Inhella proteolytica]MBH9578955.1 hypothetical protein [Inhella proteolytica]
MNRCALFAATVLVAAAPALAQTHRTFTAEALRGDFKVVLAPEARLNGKPALLSPGHRIWGADGHQLLHGAIVGQTFPVHYTLWPDGMIKEVWILNAAERANKVWPTTPAQAAQWRFEPGTQTWQKP